MNHSELFIPRDQEKSHRDRVKNLGYHNTTTHSKPLYAFDNSSDFIQRTKESFYSSSGIRISGSTRSFR